MGAKLSYVLGSFILFFYNLKEKLVNYIGKRDEAKYQGNIILKEDINRPGKQIKLCKISLLLKT